MGMKLDMIAAGAYSVALENGVSEDVADAMVSGIIEKAASDRRRYSDEYDTWWGRNKGWALPAALASAAFWAGADAVRNGRPDKSALANAGALLIERIKALASVPNDSTWDSVTKAPQD